MKKIICLGMAVAMMAALAIPASAADGDTGTTTQACNTTVVKFDYKNSDNDIDQDNKDGTYAITIPATVSLTAGSMETDKDKNNIGMGFSSKDNKVTFSGFIGQDDCVKLYVQSTNGYELTGAKNPVAYTMKASTTSNEISLTTKDFSSTMVDKDNTDISKSVNEMSITSDKGFVDCAEISLDFANDGATGIFGKCEIQDTLTFSYSYGDYDKENGKEADGYIVFSDPLTGANANTFKDKITTTTDSKNTNSQDNSDQLGH